MDELEVKFFDIDPNEIKRKLEELHAEKVFSGSVSSIFMDRGNYDLRRSKRTLRLRCNDNRGMNEDDVKSTLTFKKKREDVGLRVHKELEVKIDDLERCKTLFGMLGFGVIDEEAKGRISYIKNFGSDAVGRIVRFELDTPMVPFSDLGTYLELESKVEREDLKVAAETLNLPWEEATSMSFINYLERVRNIKPEYRDPNVVVDILPYTKNISELRRIRIPVQAQEIDSLLQSFRQNSDEEFNVYVFDYGDYRLKNQGKMLLMYESARVQGEYPISLRCLGESKELPFGLRCNDTFFNISSSKDSISSLLSGLDIEGYTTFKSNRRCYTFDGTTLIYDINRLGDKPFCFIQIDASNSDDLSRALSNIRSIQGFNDLLSERPVVFKFSEIIEQ